MPLYEYYCFGCSVQTERLRPIDERNDAPCCDMCASPMEFIVSVPSVQVWKTDRAFPNLTGYGDGSMKFEDRKKYEEHLLENGVDELSTSAPNYTSHGNRVVGSWK